MEQQLVMGLSLELDDFIDTVFFSLDGGVSDPLVPAGWQDSAAQQGFNPGDILVSHGLPNDPQLAMPATLLGLDKNAPGEDDVDALALQTDPDTGQISRVWFSVRRGSAIIGQP